MEPPSRERAGNQQRHSFHTVLPFSMITHCKLPKIMSSADDVFLADQTEDQSVDYPYVVSSTLLALAAAEAYAGLTVF